MIDTGIGIAEADLPRVFDDYYRAADAASAGPGVGLGLSIVRHAAELLGHRLLLRSRPGQGTSVSLNLPLARSEPRNAPDRATAAAAEAFAGTVQALSGAFVAVLEDDADARDALAATLQQWGCHVVQGDSIVDLLRAAESHLRCPDLIVTDYHLRADTTGLDAVVRLRSEWEQPSLPALLLTAESSIGVLDRARSLAVPVLHKPASSAQLAGRLARLLGSGG